MKGLMKEKGAEVKERVGGGEVAKGKNQSGFSLVAPVSESSARERRQREETQDSSSSSCSPPSSSTQPPPLSAANVNQCRVMRLNKVASLKVQQTSRLSLGRGVT